MEGQREGLRRLEDTEGWRTQMVGGQVEGQREGHRRFEDTEGWRTLARATSCSGRTPPTIEQSRMTMVKDVVVGRVGLHPLSEGMEVNGLLQGERVCIPCLKVWR